MTYSIDHNRLQQFGSLEFLAKQVVEGFIVGLHQSPFHGFSVEFAEHRLYNAGESIKNIDWKLYGRTDKLFVKRFEEETNLRCILVVDNSSSMYFPVRERPDIDHPNKITFSIYAAAALMNLMRRQRDAVGLNVFAEKLEFTSAARSSSVHFKYLYTELEKMLVPIPVETRRDTAATSALHEIADNIHKRSLVVIFSDMFETYADTSSLFAALQHLRHNKHEVVLFHVVDKKQEIDFDFENRPYKFIDLESGRQVKVNPLEVKEEYNRAIQSFTGELKMKCGQYRIDFVEADINAGFEQILLPYLLKRERLY
ncbi:MAG: DUF58 domain-containing protein [Bacteroidales bacterium]|nr:DUF58 domain-containing protein [Bacteroidales bacterium]